MKWGRIVIIGCQFMNLKNMALLEKEKYIWIRKNELATYIDMVFVCEKWVMYMGWIPECECYCKKYNLIKIHLYKPEKKEICVDKLEFISALCCNFLCWKCDFRL